MTPHSGKSCASSGGTMTSRWWLAVLVLAAPLEAQDITVADRFQHVHRVRRRGSERAYWGRGMGRDRSYRGSCPRDGPEPSPSGADLRRRSRLRRIRGRVLEYRRGDVRGCCCAPDTLFQVSYRPLRGARLRHGVHQGARSWLSRRRRGFCHHAAPNRDRRPPSSTTTCG